MDVQQAASGTDFIPMVPPNLTGDLHLGHALMVSVQDVIVRSRRRAGRQVAYVPGVDHAGLAMHALVVRNDDFEPGLPLPRRLRAWAAQNRRTIRSQLRALELSCNWRLETYTLSRPYVRLVHETFRALALDGHVYRRRSVQNWCPGCETTISDLETEWRPKAVDIAVLHCQLGQRLIPLQLVNPELIWGAVALVMPDGSQGEAELVELPERRLRVISDDRLASEPVLLIPAHDPLHEVVARDHQLEVRDVLDESGASLPPEARGMSREKLRAWTVSELGLRTLRVTKPTPQCRRCGAALVSRRSWQWFLRLQPLTRPVIEELVTGQIAFTPAGIQDQVMDWLRRADEWCVSRQIRWGQRIPAYRCSDCAGWSLGGGHCSCGRRLVAETDVLDTWFGCALWPLAAGRWPDGGLYPAATLTTGRDILFFWLVRCLALCRYMTGVLPTASCFVHGLVLSDRGEKMSKSAGNTVTVTAAVGRYGADAVRAGLLAACRGARDIPLASLRFETQTRVSRLVAALAEFHVTRGTLEDSLEHWALQRARRFRGQVAEATTQYRFSEAVQALDSFATSVLAPFLEARRRESHAAADPPRVSPALLVEVAELFEPFMPVATHELSRRLRGKDGSHVQVDEARAGAADRLLMVFAELRRLRGAVGLNTTAPVWVTLPEPESSLLARERWPVHAMPLHLALGRPAPAMLSWRVASDPSSFVHLPGVAAPRLMKEAIQRLRREARSRRFKQERLLAARAGGASAAAALENRIAAIDQRILILRENLDRCRAVVA